MKISAGNSYEIQLDQSDGLGGPWTVRLYRKVLFFKRRVSSDWFLDADQAKTFADQLAQGLSHHGSPDEVISRRPGWTLHRPKHNPPAT
jgi:hypothetical protein